MLPAVMLVGAVGAAELSLGLTQTYNDPFLEQRGLMISAAHTIAPSVSAGFNLSAFRDRGTSDWKTITTQLVEDNHISPDISKRNLDAAFTLAIEPFHGEVGGITAGVRMYGGLGVVMTTDDLDALQAKGDPRAESTAVQIHPGQVWGTVSDVFLSEEVALRFRWHHVTYIETVNATTLEMKNNAQYGLEVVIRLGVSSGTPTSIPGRIR